MNQRLFTFTAVVLVALLAGRAALAGPAIDLEAYRGKVLVVDFWASWCVPCRRSFPWMNSMQEKYGADGLVFIGVNMDSDATLAENFLRDYPSKFQIISDPDGELAREYDVIAMPSSYVFGRDGTLVKRHLGFKVKRQDEYEAILVESLGNSAEGG